ncbi:hypothetical protein CFIO01_07032 [Colletotrichum fioriniae PJ7]|uniref:PNPLA domain-containing protein n=1 Tax=Colletotrichum fioriniae PJ7 TaxID=1445577 RepID=A0A010R050_9PEZI|nr:hypothetical protein CFIO01_07032 [Colletotrichum fioriniae PJ7]
MVGSPATRHPNGARLLALDGGGVRGVVSLLILQELMRRVQVRKKLEKEPLPVDYFELAAGTSTGGIIGIMLFRLRMTATEAIAQYDIIAEDVFKPKIYGWSIGFLGNTLSSWVNNSKTVVQSSRFDDGSLVTAINRVVDEHGLDKDDKWLKGEALLQHPSAGKLLVCTTAQNRGETVLMKTYKNTNVYTSSTVNNLMKSHGNEITMSLATRATSAAPTYFPEVKWPAGAEKPLTFWDGGLLNNNPIDQLWNARYDLVQPGEAQEGAEEPKISCVISLGTGYNKTESPNDSWFRLTGVAATVMAFATNTEAKGKDFSRHMAAINGRQKGPKTAYIRFNPTLGENKIGLADYTQMTLLKELTTKYIKQASGNEYFEKAVDAICC